MTVNADRPRTDALIFRAVLPDATIDLYRSTRDHLIRVVASRPLTAEEQAAVDRACRDLYTAAYYQGAAIESFLAVGATHITWQADAEERP